MYAVVLLAVIFIILLSSRSNKQQRKLSAFENDRKCGGIYQKDLSQWPVVPFCEEEEVRDTNRVSSNRVLHPHCCCCWEGDRSSISFCEDDIGNSSGRRRGKAGVTHLPRWWWTRFVV